MVHNQSCNPPDPQQPETTDSTPVASNSTVTLDGAFAAAVQHHRTGQFGKAAALYRRILAAEPMHVDALHLLGVVLGQTAKKNEAIELISKALSLNPDLAEACNNLGIFLKDVGRLDEAIASYRRAIALNPDYAAAHNNLGNACQGAGDFKEAIVAFKRAIELKPEFAEAYYNLGNAYTDHRGALSDRCAHEEAVSAFERAIEIQPGRSGAHSNLGNALLLLGRFDEAVAAFRRAVEIRPDRAVAHSNLGGALRMAGQIKDAIDAHRRAVEIGPDIAEMHYTLGRVLQTNGELDEAIECYRRAIEIRQELALAHAHLARALLIRGEPDRALEACNAFLDLEPRNIRALAFKSIALSELGERESVRVLVDFDRFIRPSRFERATGFDNLAGFNSALAHHVRAHPTLDYAPRAHATRFGMHSGELLSEPEGAIGVLETMIGGAVEDYITSVPQDDSHPFLATRPRSWQLTAWAVIMESQGHQISHIHASSWLSGVYYVKLPKVVSDPGHGQAGWIEFAQRIADIELTVEPDVKAFRPEEGLMLIFPSYFYHRTIPYAAEEERISISFDVKAEF